MYCQMGRSTDMLYLNQLAVKMHDDVSGGLEQCFGSDFCTASTMILSYHIEGTGLCSFVIFLLDEPERLFVLAFAPLFCSCSMKC